MNYPAIYNRLCERGKIKRNNIEKWGTFEKHHIIPKHNNGNNNAANITTLHQKEHLLAHHLLFKIYKNYKDNLAYRILKYRFLKYKTFNNQQAYKEFMKAIGLKQVEMKKGIHNKEGNLKAIVACKEWRLNNPELVKEIAINSHKNRTKTDYLKMAATKSKHIIIAPDGLVFKSVAEAAYYYNLPKHSIDNWTRRKQKGWSRTQNTDKD